MTDDNDWAALSDMAALQQCSRREVRYICAYCEREIEAEDACCGESQAIPMPEGFDED